MDQQYLYIDDSGDPGLSKSSSSRFIIAAVIVADRISRDEIALEIDKYRRSLGWNELDEFKFNKTRKKIIKELIHQVLSYNFSARAIVIDKAHLELGGNQTLVYDETIKDLLVTMKFHSPIITIDGRSNKRAMRQTASYIRQNLKITGSEVKAIRFEDSRRSSLIQLADVVAGSIARSYQLDKTDSQEYIQLLNDRVEIIYRP